MVEDDIGALLRLAGLLYDEYSILIVEHEQ